MSQRQFYTKRELLYELKIIAQLYGIRVKFTPNLKHGGYADIPKRYIIVNTKIERSKNGPTPLTGLLSNFFHELAHIVNADNKKFPIYHLRKSYDTPPKKGFIQTAWRAERYTDKVAKRLMREFYPGVKFVGGYQKKDKKFILEYYRGFT